MHEVLSIMKAVQTQPQVEIMNRTYFDFMILLFKKEMKKNYA